MIWHGWVKELLGQAVKRAEEQGAVLPFRIIWRLAVKSC